MILVILLLPSWQGARNGRGIGEIGRARGQRAGALSSCSHAYPISPVPLPFPAPATQAKMGREE